MDLGLKGKVVIVGGASKGIGKATALVFAREGAKVAISARDPDMLQGTAEEIRKATGAEILPFLATYRKLRQLSNSLMKRSNISVPCMSWSPIPAVLRWVDSAICRTPIGKTPLR